MVIGEGTVGMAAARCRPIRVGNLGQMSKYSRSVRRSIASHEGVEPGRDIALPGLPDAQSQLSVPARRMGELVGVLVVESADHVAFDDADEQRLEVVAGLLATAVELERSRARADSGTTPDPVREPGAGVVGAGHDGALLPRRRQHLPRRRLPHQGCGRPHPVVAAAEPTGPTAAPSSPTARCDSTRSLELPEFRDNFESRLILLKRRLDERDAPIRIEKTGRGRFRLVVHTPLTLDAGRRSAGLARPTQGRQEAKPIVGRRGARAGILAAS